MRKCTGSLTRSALKKVVRRLSRCEFPEQRFTSLLRQGQTWIVDDDEYLGLSGALSDNCDLTTSRKLDTEDLSSEELTPDGQS